jgi:hypothetical protein
MTNTTGAVKSQMFMGMHFQKLVDESFVLNAVQHYQRQQNSVLNGTTQ